ncbi:MAG TPA: KEOPS complex subunit Pcc1 [Methanoculleus sp.]|nr:KEOPS complex subunit Pcc1 [Methanoculleus sp.]
MTRIEGTIETPHSLPGCVAAALEPDNLTLIRTYPVEGGVRTEIGGTRLRSIIASVDDYLMNLAIAEEICNLPVRSERAAQNKDIQEVK